MAGCYTSNGAGDVLYLKDINHPEEFEIIDQLGSVPAAMDMAQHLQKAYERGRASLASDFTGLLATTST